LALLAGLFSIGVETAQQMLAPDTHEATEGPTGPRIDEEDAMAIMQEIAGGEEGGAPAEDPQAMAMAQAQAAGAPMQ